MRIRGTGVLLLLSLVEPAAVASVSIEYSDGECCKSSEFDLEPDDDADNVDGVVDETVDKDERESSPGSANPKVAGVSAFTSSSPKASPSCSSKVSEGD